MYILFTDDTFTLQPERVKKLCQGLRERQKKQPFKWFCEGHVHMLYTHPEMIQYIADGGAQRIQLGIEAGTQEVLDAYRKGSTLDEIRSVVAQCRDAGIEQIFSNIILAGAFYTHEVYEKNLAFAKELITLGKGCVEIGVVSFWPLPQTSMTLHPQDYGLHILDSEFLTACGDFPQVETAVLNRWDILQMVRDMNEELERHMVGMLQRREVPVKLIFSWFPRAGCKGAQGNWWQCLCKEPALYAYYSMLYAGEALSYEEVKKDIRQVHPMRVLPLDHFVVVSAADCIEIQGCRLQGWQRYVLVLATGKLSVQEIIAYMQRHDMAPEQGNMDEQVITVLQELERHHVIVFSIY